MNDKQLLELCINTLDLMFSELEGELLPSDPVTRKVRAKYTLSNMSYNAISSIFEWIKMEKRNNDQAA